MARDTSRLPAITAGDELRNSLAHRKYSIPNLHPPQMKNKGNYIASISRVDAWLGGIAETTQFLLFASPDAEEERRAARPGVAFRAGHPSR
ncbi:hypothetical protein K438DRAFT_1982103 [Mycena galopus ATCC 62051]|nr:hypothetical protein K438DRAFT_1982103 [Mycena galopus ATCC 62051]